jgi:hypothetical protein
MVKEQLLLLLQHHDLLLMLETKSDHHQHRETDFASAVLQVLASSALARHGGGDVDAPQQEPKNRGLKTAVGQIGVFAGSTCWTSWS